MVLLAPVARFRRGFLWKTPLAKVVTSFALLVALWHLYSSSIFPLPPLYPEMKDQDRRLPQHSLSLPFPEGKNGRYLRFGNQLWGTGLNNQLQEILLYSYIAHESNRAYVFQPYIWDHSMLPYVPIGWNSHLARGKYFVRPARVPLSAYLDSPTTGTAWPVGDQAPRSISNDWWDRVCPASRQLRLSTTEVNMELGLDMEHAEASVIVERWSRYLRELTDPCVEIIWGSPRIIDFNLVGSNRMPSVWPAYSQSPVATSFQWSPIVRGGVERNLPLLYFASRVQKKPPASSSPYIAGLVSLHVRRGDFKGHCKWMSSWVELNGWAQLDFLPDRWHPPWSTPTEPGEARASYALNRCWIDIPAIVARLEETRKEFPHSAAPLDRVFISTNGDDVWLNDAKVSLAASGWRVITSRDLKLDWRQEGVSVAIDMEIASQAEVFIGNGFSSMTSNIIQLRLARGVPADNSRLW